jgi:hypothetical protein
VAGLRELADDGGDLVCGDATGDADDDPSRSSWISRSAIDNGFSCRPGSTSGPTYSRMPSPSWL